MDSPSRKKLVWFVVIIAVIGSIAATTGVIRPYLTHTSAADTIPVSAPTILGVSCIGRIQSEDGPIVIGARSLSGQPSLVRQLRAREGDIIKQGQVIAILDSREQLEAAWHQAEARVKVAESHVNGVMAGAKAADIAAQDAEVTRLEVAMAGAQTDFDRTDNLFKQGIASQATLDQRRLTLQTTAKMIDSAKERRRSLTEIRQVDVDEANAELQAAIADAQLARAQADAATVLSPYTGRVQKIHAWQGEEVGANGILELAKVEHMYVVAEVSESDIQRVKIGQRAEITGDSLPQKLEGKVVQLGLKVSRNSMVLRNPLSVSDAKIVEVKILLDDGHSVDNLIDAQVQVLILP